jgi:hypothetical protein
VDLLGLLRTSHDASPLDRRKLTWKFLSVNFGNIAREAGLRRIGRNLDLCDLELELVEALPRRVVVDER